MEDDPQAIVRAYWERVWNKGELEAVDELIADPYVRHSANGNVIRARARVREDMGRYLELLADTEVTIEDQAVSGDTVWTRISLRGLNVETEEMVILSWLHVARVADGRIAEGWNLNAPVDWTTPARVVD